MSRLPIITESPRAQALPTVAALAALWDEVSARPLWAPPNFFRYLKLRWRARLAPVDPERVALAVTPGKINDCSACTDICCVGSRSAVLLRLRDIATLLDIGRTDLIGHDKPVFTTLELAARPALRRQVGSASWSTFPVLRQNSMHACMALTKEGKCSLYPHWPLACARFPYALHADDREVFWSARCDSFSIRHDVGAKVSSMKLAAVASYNERIKDLVLLSYAPERLGALGLLTFLAPPEAEKI